MAIGMAVQKGGIVYVYDEKGRELATKGAGMGKNDGLKGYTSGTFTVQIGNILYTYNEKGGEVSTTSAGF